MPRSTLIPLLSMLALGCGTARPGQPEGPVRASLESIRPVASRGSPATAEASGEAGAIRVTGYVLLPTRCHTLGVDAAQESGATSVLIFARDTLRPGRGCADMMHPVAFVASVRGLEAGAHRLRVSYSPNKDRARPALMLESVVQVR